MEILLIIFAFVIGFMLAKSITPTIENELEKQFDTMLQTNYEYQKKIYDIYKSSFDKMTDDEKRKNKNTIIEAKKMFVSMTENVDRFMPNITDEQKAKVRDLIDNYNLMISWFKDEETTVDK